MPAKRQRGNSGAANSGAVTVDNDVFEMLRGLSKKVDEVIQQGQTLGERLDGMIEKVDGLDTLDGMVKKVDEKVDVLDDKLVKKVDGLDDMLAKKVDGLDDKLVKKVDGLDDKLAKKVDGLDEKLAEQVEKMSADSKWGVVWKLQFDCSINRPIGKKSFESIKANMKNLAEYLG